LPAPVDAYGQSKWAAEKALVDTASGALDHVVVRAPLIYGAGVRGNLLALLRLSDSTLPLPFGAIDNRRSFLHVDDLARLLLACAAEPHAAGRVYLAAHCSPLSTPQLVGLMRERLERPARLVRVPPALLEAAASLVGLRATMRRLTRSLEVDSARAESELHWSAQISLESAVDDMVNAYRAETP
jgi:UDP-glucose 4-epimerase